MHEAVNMAPEGLEQVFAGTLGYCAGTLTFEGDEPGFVPASDLLRPDVLHEMLDAFGRLYPDADRRAIASLWSQWYFGTLIVPAAAASLMLYQVLPLRIERVGFRLDSERNHPVGFRLDGVPDPAPGADAFTLLEDLVWRHLDPLIDEIARAGRVSRRLLWSNAGGYLEWAVRQVERRPGGCAAAAAGDLLLKSKSWPDGRSNPLLEPVRYVWKEGAETRRRRVCCLRYLLPGVAGCGEACPLAKVRRPA